MCGPEAPSAEKGGRRLAHHRHGRRSNPNGLAQIEATSFPLDRSSIARTDARVSGAYRTDQGAEIVVWADVGPDGSPRAPYHTTVYSPSTGELFDIEDWPDMVANFETAMEAMGSGLRVALEIEQSSWSPRRDLGFDENLEGFLKRPRNRVDFYRLFTWNDPNGSHESTLLDPTSEVESTFEDMFGDLVDSGPRVETFAAIKKRLMRT